MRHTLHASLQRLQPSRRSVARRVGLGLAAVLLSCSAAAATLDERGDSSAFASAQVVSGGVGLDEFAEFDRDRRHSLKLLTVAKGSGAYLADVEVTIASLSSGETVLQHRTEGPLLLAALPAGRYRITARYADVLPGAATTVSRVVSVPQQGQLRQVIVFDTADAVADGRQR